MRVRTIRAMGQAVVASALVIACVVVVSQAASAATPPNYFVRNNGSAVGNCKSWALVGANKACTLTRALALATVAGDRILMRKGVYSAAGNDVINTSDLGTDTGLVITGGYNGVGNPGAFAGTTTLDPPALGGGNGIIDFSSNSAITVRRLKVDSALAPPYAVGQAPVFNAGGTNDTLGALPAAFRVTVLGGAPTNAIDLTGGSATITNVVVKPQYTGDGILCFGSATCSVTQSTVTGTTGTTGIVVYGATGATITTSVISGNADGGVNLEGSTGGTVAHNTISNNADGGVLIEQAFGATIANNTLAANAGGGIFAEANCGSPCQTYGPNDTIANNTLTGASSAGIELELMGGFSITGNTITTASTGPGILLIGSDNNNISSTNTVTGSQVGIYVGGNDLTGPSDGNTVSSNNFSNNELAGAVADGYGSPETWNRQGTGNQGIQGEVFFQSSVAVPTGATNGNGSPLLVVSPAFGPGDFSGVAGYLAVAGAICPTGVPVDGQGGNLSACTDGLGDIFVEGTVGTAIPAETGTATGTTGPGVQTMSNLPFYNEVASGNTFDNNIWSPETIFGAIDGSGPYGEAPPSGSNTYLDANPAAPPNIQNAWINNSGSPGVTPCNPATGPVPPGPGPECGT